MRSALEGGFAELRLGEIAVAKAGSADVKQFGQKMIDDQTRLADEMRDIAQQEGIRPPVEAKARDKALESKLMRLSGLSFDKAYIAAMLKDHRQVLDAFNREISKGNDTAIKDAAARLAQLISEHLKLAKELARTHNVGVAE